MAVLGGILASGVLMIACGDVSEPPPSPNDKPYLTFFKTTDPDGRELECSWEDSRPRTQRDSVSCWPATTPPSPTETPR